MEKPPTVERTGRPIAVFSNSYARLPERFFARLAPTPATKPRLIKFNESLASELGSMRKASNRTRWRRCLPATSRRRAQSRSRWLTPGINSAISSLSLATAAPHWGRSCASISSAKLMHALGVPTTRALAAVSTGEPVYRDRELPGAVLTRVASSHIRVGTFQYFAARGDRDAVERLADYVIDRHFRDAERPRLALIQAVVERQALLIARWMHVGFIHGVMNTDNTALSGETIDF
jgi:uncharacterized protein YdiU (UPF0061 family)